LCRGFEQITLILPLRIMILHLLHIFFTELLTFMASLRFPG
jgi:hypothetical protein